MNPKERIIKGYTELHLIPENKYRVSYGINQGIYIYKGQLEESDDKRIILNGKILKRTFGNKKL